MEPTDREIYLAELASSDEGVESLLAGGADVDTLIEAGVLDDGEERTLASEEIEPEEETLEPVDQTPMSPEDFQKMMDEDNELLRRWPPMKLSVASQKLIAERGSRNASSHSR